MSSVVTEKTDEKVYLNSFCFGYRLHNLYNLLPDFSRHLFRSPSVRKQIIATASGVTRFNVSKKKMEKVRVPIPPLEVQQEIVRILDTFTTLEAELEAELEARKKQYEWYKENIIWSLSDVYIKKLGDISTSMFRGQGIKRDEISDSGIPCVRYGEIYTTYGIWFDKCKSHTIEEKIQNRKYFDYGDILFVITGESVDEISKSTAYVGKERCLAGGDIVVMKHNENPKYLAYALSTSKVQIQKSKGKVKSKVVHSSIPDLSKIEIPVPPLIVQENIVKILDNYNELTSDIALGLPSEISARRKQYEYYRNKLLTFKEASND